MRVDALTKSLEYHNMRDVFRILLEQTVNKLDQGLEALFACQSTKRDALRDAALDPTYNKLIVNDAISSREVLRDLDTLTIQ